MQIVGKFWLKFYRKIEFLFLGKLLTKNRAFGNNTIFNNNFFGFGGGSPGYALAERTGEKVVL